MLWKILLLMPDLEQPEYGLFFVLIKNHVAQGAFVLKYYIRTN